MGKPFDAKKDIIILLFYGSLIMTITVVALLVFSAIDELQNLTKFTFYFVLFPTIIAVLFAIAYFRGIYINKDFPLIINESEKSPLLPKFLRNTPTLLFGIGGLLLLLIALGIENPQSVIGNIGQTSLPNYLQTVITSTLGSIIFDVEPASSVETLGNFAVSMVFLFILFKIFNTNLTEVRNSTYLFIGIGFLYILFWGFSWVLFHTARYGGNEAAIIASFKFGIISGILIWVFQSVIYALLYHQYNNGFLSILERVGSSDLYAIYIGLIAITFIAIAFYTRYNKSFNDKIVRLIPL